LNFKDYWAYNVAGYELAKILELNMLPPYVPRKVHGQEASVSWWVNDSMMEIDRKNRHMEPPDLDSWNKQMYAVRVWHQLIYDTDPNLTNILISKDWQIWIIDCSRAFRLSKDLRDPKDLVQCDRRLLAKLRTLDKDMLKEKLSHWLTKGEIDGTVLVFGANPYQINVLDLASHQQPPLLKHPTYTLLYARFSPDNRWVSFTVRTDPNRGQPQSGYGADAHFTVSGG